jgi:uncharacterized protein (TIGR02453 family)
MAQLFGDEAFEFYEGLRADNSKTYWTAHKQIYDDFVRAPMQQLLDDLAARFDGEPKVFRPYRDVRFSADKSPYKTAQGGVVLVAPEIGYWVQVDAEGVAVGGGFFSRDRERVARYRAAVDLDAAGGALEKVLGKLAKAGFAKGEPSLRTRPRGVSADHPRLELMRHEHVTVSRHVEPGENIDADSVAADWKRVKPLVEWVQTYGV